MPKVPPKRPVEVAKPTPVVQEEPKIMVWRLFECVVHLEQALSHLRKIGISTDGTKLAFNNRVTADAVVSGMLDTYKQEWNRMRGQVDA